MHRLTDRNWRKSDTNAAVSPAQRRVALAPLGRNARTTSVRASAIADRAVSQVVHRARYLGPDDAQDTRASRVLRVGASCAPSVSVCRLFAASRGLAAAWFGDPNGCAAICGPFGVVRVSMGSATRLFGREAFTSAGGGYAGPLYDGRVTSGQADGGDVGARVAAWRERAGLTQHGLAERAHVSYSLLRKVERGERRASEAFTAAVGRALGVGADALTGPDSLHREGLSLAPIRSTLDLFDLAPDETVTPRPLPVLADAVADVNRLAQAAEYERMVSRLPALLVELHTAAHTVAGTEQAAAFGLLAEASRCGHSVGIATGDPDLSVYALSRMDWAAQRAGDLGPGLRAIREYLRVTAYLRRRDLDAAWRLNASGAEHVDGAEDAPGGLAARGQLHLGAAIIAAHGGDRDAIAGHLEQAGRDAERTGETMTFHVAFGPVNVRVHRVMAYGTLGEHGRAVEAAEPVTFPDVWLPTRVGHHWLDMARAYRWLNRPDDALTSLQRARQAAPGQARRHPLARETVTALMHSQRRRTAALTEYAAWLDA